MSSGRTQVSIQGYRVEYGNSPKDWEQAPGRKIDRSLDWWINWLQENIKGSDWPIHSLDPSITHFLKSHTWIPTMMDGMLYIYMNRMLGGAYMDPAWTKAPAQEVLYTYLQVSMYYPPQNYMAILWCLGALVVYMYMESQ